MTKDQWKAAAIVTAAIAIMTNAGAFYTRRSLEAELAQARNSAKIPQSPAPVERWPAPPTVEATDPVSMPAVEARPAGAEERCIGGELFRKHGNEWEQLHVAC